MIMIFLIKTMNLIFLSFKLHHRNPTEYLTKQKKQCNEQQTKEFSPIDWCQTILQEKLLSSSYFADCRDVMSKWGFGHLSLSPSMCHSN